MNQQQQRRRVKRKEKKVWLFGLFIYIRIFYFFISLSYLFDNFLAASNKVVLADKAFIYDCIQHIVLFSNFTWTRN